MEYNSWEIGEKIKKERQAKHLSQEELCEKVHISRNTLSALENGNGIEIHLSTLIDMCEIFECDLGYLVGEYDERTRTAADICELTDLSEEAVESLMHRPAPTGDEPEDFARYCFSLDREALNLLLTSPHIFELLHCIKDCSHANEIRTAFAESLSSFSSLIDPLCETDRLGKMYIEELEEFEKKVAAIENPYQDKFLVFNVQLAAAKLAESIVQEVRKEAKQCLTD